ncbi:hypothetical protein C9374_011578 [Naegleria lovaniensis]|uniref:cyclin-dependent kinase n=1 Tax=Naegleria lovaniensis TaxID=51637 RepID=A0AA88GEW3_NAELO|nr:uncharacterized protein C9374_011578 [Naegleria lovaniensis]KAG2373913.1 hypothetical protein C9374_011578 [Naegleria lovaniensis]
MENYDNLGVLGEGAYGVVNKCRHKETGQIVAIKKFKESDEDEQVKKTALREIRILKQLRHENIVNLLDVFRRKGKLYLVFEYIESTILGKLEEKYPYGLDEDMTKKYLYQILKGVEYCHSQNIIHRDLKPENLLVSKSGVLKIADFGFARTLEGTGAKYTDYVSTRWYRAPELVVGDREYGKAVDIWAIGCMLWELLEGQPLFPGDSDIDQLSRIINCFGKLSEHQIEVYNNNPLYRDVELPKPSSEGIVSLDSRYKTNISKEALSFIKACLNVDPSKRGTYEDLLNHAYLKGYQEWYENDFPMLLDHDNISLNSWKKSKKERLERKTSVCAVDDEKILKTKKLAKKEDTNELQDHHEMLPDISGLKARGLVGLPYLSDCKKDVSNPEEGTPPRSQSPTQFLPELHEPKSTSKPKKKNRKKKQPKPLHVQTPITPKRPPTNQSSIYDDLIFNGTTREKNDLLGSYSKYSSTTKKFHK